MRFSKVLSKEHDTFRSFMARMSDAFFVPCQSDIELVKTALGKAGLSEDDINKKEWQFFKKRVRRTVPVPKILERDFTRVINLFTDVKDAKSGKEPFNAKAWALFKTTIQHIWKGYLSDIPGEAYYMQVREDSLGSTESLPSLVTGSSTQFV